MPPQTSHSSRAGTPARVGWTDQYTRLELEGLSLSAHVHEQTVVVLPPTTLFSLPCQACVERQVEADQAVVAVRLRLDEDLAWVTCARGHKIRVIRAGRAVFEEATSPLW